MPIPVKCPHCEKAFHVADDIAGKHIKCPGCGAVIAVGTPTPPPHDEGMQQPAFGVGHDESENPFQTPKSASPRASSGTTTEDNLAIASLVCGISSLAIAFLGCCCGLLYIGAVGLAIAGLICGILGRNSSQSALAYGGIGCSAVTLVLGVLWIVLLVLNISFNAGNMPRQFNR